MKLNLTTGVRRLIAGSLLVVAATACSTGSTPAPTASGLATSGLAFGIMTAPAPMNVCDEALQTGKLVKFAQTGLGLADSTGQVTPVRWPFGYSARVGATGIELLDNTGKVVARENDIVQSTGGTGGDGVFVACSGTVEVVPLR